MASFGWRAPFPRPFGGRADERVSSLYDTIRANRPTVLKEGGPHVEAENIALARMFHAAQAETARRVAQRNPMSLSAVRRPVTMPDGTRPELSMLERQEAIFRLHPRPGDSLNDRRRAVAARKVSYTSNRSSSVTEAMIQVFGSWFHSIGRNSVSDVHYAGKSPPGNVVAHWATDSFVFSSDFPGEYHPDYPFTSGLATLCVRYQPPAHVTQEEIDRRRAIALQVLDEMLPARMTFSVSQIEPDAGGAGFKVGISKVGLTAL